MSEDKKVKKEEAKPKPKEAPKEKVKTEAPKEAKPKPEPKPKEAPKEPKPKEAPKEDKTDSKDEDFLMPMDKYLAAGVHIGTQQREASMKPYIYNVRPDGLSVFNVQLIDERIRTAAKMLSKYEPSDILIISARDSTRASADKLAEMIGAVSISDRFMPGTLTNPVYSGYKEPEIIITSDPSIDHRAITEAVNMNIPVIAICDTNNTTRNIDLVVPGNNKGRKAIALIFWLMGRELLMARGTIKKGEEPKIPLEAFQPQI